MSVDRRTQMLILYTPKTDTTKLPSIYTRDRQSTDASTHLAHPLQSPVPNPQFPPVFPAHVTLSTPSRTLHHPANTLYSIIILSHPFSTPGHFSSLVSQRSHINHCATSLE